MAYTRLNMVSAQAMEEQFDKIEELIAQLDVKSETDDYVTVTLAHADAGVVADTLSTMFGSSSAPARGRRGKAPRAVAGSGPNFVGEEGGRILFFSAPKNLHEDIHAVIDQLEEQSKVVTTPRIIKLEYATPSDVAEAIESAYGGGGGRRGGGRRGSGAASTARFTIAADDPSKRLFVVADDQLFGEIESLAKTLDQPREMPFDFKIYKLVYANARKIHETLGNLVQSYMRMAPRGAASEAFAVEVDDKANALIVLGNPTIFDFVERALATVDIEANKQSPPGFFMVALKNANAQEVAQNINRLWSQGQRGRQQTADPPPQAEANRALNLLIVRGTQEQIAEIKKEFVDPLQEQQAAELLMEAITLTHADPETVAESVNQIFQARADAIRRAGRQSNVSPLEYTVVVTPDVESKQLVVQASADNIKYVKERVALIDQPGADTGEPRWRFTRSSTPTPTGW